MRLLFLLCCFALSAFAQSITVSLPVSTGTCTVSGTTITGTNCQFMVTPTSLPALAGVQFLLDAYPATNYGLSPLVVAGWSRTAPYSYGWNTYLHGNGPAIVTAVAYDAAGNVLATSPAVSFTVVNTSPVHYIPGCTVTPGTAFTSNWSGQVSVQMTLTGTGSANSKTFWWYLEGVPQQIELNKTAATQSALIDTRQVPNGNHVVAGIIVDNSGGTTYSDGDYEGLACEWSRTVNIQNGAVASGVRTAAHDIYLAPAGTFSLAPQLLNTDGTVVSSPTFDYLMLASKTNSTVATVNSSGLITASAVSAGNAQSAKVLTMAETVTGCTDLVMSGSVSTIIWSAGCYTFTNSDVSRLLKITAGTGWTTGLYQITAVNPDTSPPQVVLDRQPATLGSTGGSFATGPTRDSWVFVWPTNTMPHFGNDFAIHTTYVEGTSTWIHEMFNGGDLINTEQPYTSPCNPGAFSGFVAEMNCTAYNAPEVGMPVSALDGYTNAAGQQAAFQTAQQNYRTGITGGLVGYSKYLWSSGDNFLRAPSNFFATVAGPASATGTSIWTEAALQYVFQDWKTNSTVQMLGVSMMDEFNYTSHPLQGPITFGLTSQSWLSSITCNGTTCTASGSGIDIGLGYISISGSSVTNMNGLNFHPTGVSSTSFTWTSSATAGTYNSGNDAGLTINPLTTNYSNGGAVIPYDAFAKLMTSVNAVSGRSFMAFPPAAPSNCTQLTNVLGPGGQSINGITQISDYNDVYTSHISENYLPTREASNSVINADPLATTGNNQGVGYLLRSDYGCTSPDKPISVIAQATPHQRGYQGYTPGGAGNVVSFTGNTLTLSANHLMPNVLPGISRVWLSGMSNSADNGNYYVISTPTATTMTLAKAGTSVACTGSCASGTTGTLTFQNGDTLSLISMTATGALDGICGQTGFQYSGTGSDAVNRHRGQTFTVSVGGPQAAYFNSHTFLYTAENLLHATECNGAVANFLNFYRELPVGSSTSGTATMLYDNSFVPGVSGWQILHNYTTLGTAFGSMIESAIVRGVMDRQYKVDSSENGYLDHFVGTAGAANWHIKPGYQGFNLIQNLWKKFADNTASGQVFAHPHFEDGLTNPIFHGNNMAATILLRWQKFLLTPALNSPDLGPLISCGARAQLLFCWNASDGPQTRTLTLTPYLQSGQKIARYIANWQGIVMTTLNAGTNTDSVTLQPQDSVWYAFPANYAAEIQQPTISARLADISGAGSIAVRYAYDLYWLDTPANTVACIGTGVGTVPVDLAFKAIAPIVYRLIYMAGSNCTGAVVATSDVSTF